MARRIPKGLRYYRREFLNHEGWYLGAHILATVWQDGNCARVNIADCDRVVRLELDAEDAAQLRNSLHKLDVLTGTLTEVREQLVDGYEKFRRQQAAGRRRNRGQS